MSEPEDIGALAALAAAISLLERSPKTAAPSDRMFDIMLDDYRRALENARQALKTNSPAALMICPRCHQYYDENEAGVTNQQCHNCDLAGGMYNPTPSGWERDYVQRIFEVAENTRQKAQRKFPQPNFVALKVAEEAGEVVRAAVHYAEGRLSWEELEGEAVQTIAMVLRLLIEGDLINGVIPPTARVLNPKDQS